MPATAPARTEDPARATVPRRLERIATYGNITDARAAWEALLPLVPATAYQTPDWLQLWCNSLGSALEPLIVVGADAEGPVALLPLATARRGGLTVAGFLGGRDANFGLGLFHPGVGWDAASVCRLLTEASRLGAVDVFWLRHQPARLDGMNNPLTLLRTVPSPSFQHEARLGGGPEAVLPRLLSARARKHIRQKQAKLAALGDIRHVVAADPATARRIAAALVAQRRARFGPTGRDVALEAFLAAAAVSPAGPRPALELHALSCGDALVATFAGSGHAGRFSGLMVSFAPEPEWARFSPGELLIARIVADKCRDGSDWFDLGVGEAPYKDRFCPEVVPLFDTVLGVSLRGRFAAALLVALLGVKRAIKRNARLRAAFSGGQAWWRSVSGGFAARGR